MADSSPLAHSPTLAAGEPRVLSDDERLATDAKVGEYVIERFIGSGAMGEVYAGRHPVINKRVAIKVLRHELASSAEAAERFIREARAVNQIEHANVIDVFAFGRLDDGRLYLVMDLVDGRSLRAHLIDGPLELSAALDILDVIADALDAAHTKGVVHRDLKPDNIVLSSSTPPKVFVLDFGIAKLVSKVNEGGATVPGTLTGQGTWLGTPGYMAPEQWSTDGAGPASDRYALGVIAFELLSGALPFSASSVPGMMEQHFRAEVPALSTRGAVGVPTAIDGVLRRALAKDPDARHATARELVDSLRAAAGTNALRARGAVAVPSTPRKLWIPAAAGAGILGVAFVVVLTTRDDDKQPIAAPPVADDRKQPAGTVTIDVSSTPSDAEVKAGDRVVGRTPTPVYLRPGAELEITVSKPGYLTQSRTVKAGPSGSVTQVTLGEVTEFEGVWKLSNGELREFKRTGDEVEVYKAEAVSGPRTFFKKYGFETTEHGVAFGAAHEYVDPRAPDDPRCHLQMRVVYHYDPAQDVLEQRRDKLNVDFQDKSCTLRSREVEPTKLARVDGKHDTRVIEAPVGKPIVNDLGNLGDKNLKAPPTKVKRAPVQEKVVPKKKAVLPLDPKAAELERQQKQKLAEQKKLEAAAQNIVNKPTKPYTPPKQANAAKNQAADPFDQQASVPPSQVLPQPQPAAPQVGAEEPEIQQRQKK